MITIPKCIVLLPSHLHGIFRTLCWELNKVVSHNVATSDRFPTEVGDLYHGCRYVSANQFPYAEIDLAKELYDDYVAFYKAWSTLIGEGVSVQDIAEKIVSLRSIKDKRLALNELQRVEK